MNIVDEICKRRSTRKYKDQEVSKEMIHELLIAATCAPTAGNREPWEFVIVNESAKLNSIREFMPYGKYNAPLAIVVCGNMNNTLEGPAQEMWVQDCSAATENMMIAASALGLGSVWLGVYPIEAHIKYLKKLLNLPKEVVPLNVIYFGYADEVQVPRNRLNEEKVHYNTYTL